MKVAHVSTFPEMKCGIALYTSDLLDALPLLKHRKYALHYGTNVTADATGHADVSQPSHMRELARDISQSDCHVVSLQHEFGIWGGQNGEHIFDFIEDLTKPIVATLHTTFRSSRRPATQLSILARLVERSAVTFVLTPNSRDTLCSALGIDSGAIAVIPHGVPNIPFSSPPGSWNPVGGVGPTCKLCSIGFFRPDKGIELVLHALRSLKDSGYQFEYVMAGEPQGQFEGQEQYFNDVNESIRELNLADRVRIIAKFLTRGEQIQIVQEAHAGVFAYQDPDQGSSGTIPLVMAAGRPVICTPFEFALAKEREVGGVTLAKDFDAAAIAEALARFFASGSNYLQDSRTLHERTRHWTWQAVGVAYAGAFAEAQVRGRSFT